MREVICIISIRNNFRRTVTGTFRIILGEHLGLLPLALLTQCSAGDDIGGKKRGRKTACLRRDASIFRPVDRWSSGRWHRTRNAASLQGLRGFESHPVRHKKGPLVGPFLWRIGFGERPTGSTKSATADFGREAKPSDPSAARTKNMPRACFSQSHPVRQNLNGPVADWHPACHVRLYATEKTSAPENLLQ